MTNTYFEGRKTRSKIAQFGRSKEKRSDCKIAASLTKKSGVKTEEKVYERVGRLKQKYPSVSRYYQIDYTVETETVKNRKTKENTEVRKVKAISWKVK